MLPSRSARWLAVATLGALLAGVTSCGDSEDSSGQDDMRVVAHAMGTTEVPAEPERVVVLDTGELDAVTALGVTPVGAVEALSGEGFLGYLRGDTAGVEIVGTIQEPNLEKIAALDPDLILSNKTRHEDIYDQLSAIAPTVFAEKVGVVWKDNFLLDARALGKEDKASSMLIDYDKRTQDLGARIGNPADTVVSLIRYVPGQIRLYAKGSFIGTVLEDVGFSRPTAQQADKTFVEISAEQMTLADGDILFVSTYGPSADTEQAAVTAGPLWNTLNAVRSGNVHTVADDHWMLGIGIGAAQLVLDDLQKYLV